MRLSARECKFDPIRDALEVVSGLAVNVTEMLETGIVHDSADSLDNNGIDDPNQIIGLVRDEFAAIDAMRAIRKFGKKAPAEAEKAAAAATAPGAPAPSNEPSAS